MRKIRLKRQVARLVEPLLYGLRQKKSRDVVRYLWKKKTEGAPRTGTYGRVRRGDLKRKARGGKKEGSAHIMFLLKKKRVPDYERERERKGPAGAAKGKKIRGRKRKREAADQWRIGEKLPDIRGDENKGTGENSRGGRTVTVDKRGKGAGSSTRKVKPTVSIRRRNKD